MGISTDWCVFCFSLQKRRIVVVVVIVIPPAMPRSSYSTLKVCRKKFCLDCILMRMKHIHYCIALSWEVQLYFMASQHDVSKLNFCIIHLEMKKNDFISDCKMIHPLPGFFSLSRYLPNQIWANTWIKYKKFLSQFFFQETKHQKIFLLKTTNRSEAHFLNILGTS